MTTHHTTPETQPEALRLANYLEKEWVTGDCLNAARELRRLHTENAALAATQGVTAAPQEGVSDPLDWPLPCDVTVGHGTMRKGVALRSLVLRMKSLYEMATGQNADEVANRTPAERQALWDKSPLNLDNFRVGGRFTPKLTPEAEALSDQLGIYRPAPPPLSPPATGNVGADDLAMLVKQLAHSLRKAAPDSTLPDKAMDYLKRKDLLGSVLRTANDPMGPIGEFEATMRLRWLKSLIEKQQDGNSEEGRIDPDTGSWEGPEWVTTVHEELDSLYEAAVASKGHRFQETYCSQCGGKFGPGDGGYSHCSAHVAAALPPPGRGMVPMSPEDVISLARIASSENHYAGGRVVRMEFTPSNILSFAKALTAAGATALGDGEGRP